MKNPFRHYMTTIPDPACKHKPRHRKWNGYVETCTKCGQVVAVKPLPPKTWTPEPLIEPVPILPYGPDHTATIHEITDLLRGNPWHSDPDRTTRKDA